MKAKVHYGTVSEALEKLRQQGFTVDFNLAENLERFKNGNFDPADFEVVDAYRYEGDSDPGDEATVYAIESKSGIKGVLVSGYGHSSDVYTTDLLKRIKTRKV